MFDRPGTFILFKQLSKCSESSFVWFSSADIPWKMFTLLKLVARREIIAATKCPLINIETVFQTTIIYIYIKHCEDYIELLGIAICSVSQFLNTFPETINAAHSDVMKISRFITNLVQLNLLWRFYAFAWLLPPEVLAHLYISNTVAAICENYIIYNNTRHFHKNQRTSFSWTSRRDFRGKQEYLVLEYLWFLSKKKHKK